MPSAKFTLSYESLSVDCGQLQPYNRGTREDLDETSLLECLQAFAAIPSLDLADHDATIRVRHEQKQVAISRSGDDLYLTPIPEASHTPEKSTPDGIIAYLTGREVITKASRVEVELEPVLQTRKSRLQLPFGVQIVLMVFLLSIVTALGYHTINKPAPTGYAFAKNSDQTQDFSKKIDGRYGYPDRSDSLSFEIANKTVRFYAVTQPGATPTLVKEENFRYALRGDVVALIGNNGDILEINPDGTLLFGEFSYPRIDR
ncbi:MAG: hypothetical protein K9M98_03180 [Cephaloticoccus sp.]|nr:hypothetical protein [Cephaloticoccus sp.]MCF7759485.1 hypothetical protein [Cephaloticoccus sp.]